MNGTLLSIAADKLEMAALERAAEIALANALAVARDVRDAQAALAAAKQNLTDRLNAVGRIDPKKHAELLSRLTTEFGIGSTRQ